MSSQNIFHIAPRWVVSGELVVWMFVLIGLSLRVFSPKGADPFGRKSHEEHIRELEGLGLVESSAFHATRAFAVGEYEDEGLHYFIELADGAVLFLSGQYLYDFAPITDDAELNQARSFPCSEFTVRRHRKEGYVVDIICGGTVLEPEVEAPPFGKKVWKRETPSLSPMDTTYTLGIFSLLNTLI